MTIGRAGILHHDFPVKVMKEPDFKSIELPVTTQHLQAQGLSERFINYMKNWKGFVKV